MFIDEGLARFLFLWVKRVHLSNLWNKRRLKVDGVVIGSVGGKNIMGFLGEHIVKVGAPIRDLLVRGF